MRVCRAGRKPGVEPFVFLHGHPKANHRSRFNHLPPFDFLPFGFGMSHAQIFSGRWRNVEKETGGGISNSFKTSGIKHNKASLRMPCCDQTKCQLPLWIWGKVIINGVWRGGGTGIIVRRVNKRRLLRCNRCRLDTAVSQSQIAGFKMQIAGSPSRKSVVYRSPYERLGNPLTWRRQKDCRDSPPCRCYDRRKEASADTDRLSRHKRSS